MPLKFRFIIEKSALFIFLALCISNRSFGAETIVYGNAGTYAGTTLTMYRFSDYVTQKKQTIATCRVDTAGYFKFSLQTDETFEAFIDLDVFVAIIIIEPAKKLKIVLPKRTVRLKEDKLNPYFQPYFFYPPTPENPKSLTNVFKRFDKDYKSTLNKVFKNRRDINYTLLIEELKNLDSLYKQPQNSFFQTYAKYKILYMKHLSYFKNKKALLRQIVLKDKIHYYNPGYNLTFQDIFGNFVTENNEQMFKFLYNAADWFALENHIQHKYSPLLDNKDFREYMLLVNLCQLFHTHEDLKLNIIKIMRNALHSGITGEVKAMIQNFLDENEALILNKKAPDFVLYNTQKDKINLENFQGQFVYLNFMQRGNYACEKDMDLLRMLHAKEIDNLAIVTIINDEAPMDSIRSFVEKKDYQWTILQCFSKDKVLKDYKVSAYPAYFLIHPEGSLLMHPAPSPEKNFEAAYFKVYRAWKVGEMQQEEE
ncbi:MAG: hypothetical protein CSB06_02735 [Bacteroidia bacterium]|nr:MAG: hypothetical protein CSB06_02735 [Bacteroidia bacterium]